jgi:quinoprotein glucose dehydrogenase
MRRLLIGLVLAAGALLLVSVMGGSLFWWMLGLGDRMVIKGSATIVAGATAGTASGWPAYGGDPGGSRYSSAGEITRENVRGLEVAWTARTGAFKGRDAVIGRTAFEATPILVGDKLVVCSPFNEVIAYHPGTGMEIWRHDPKIDLGQRPANQFICRGVSQWRDALQVGNGVCSTRLFMGTNDGRLIALDAETGRPCEDFGAGGEVKIEPSTALWWPGERQITSAPAIVGDTVVVGSALSDNLRVEAPRGTVHAFDVRTGAPRWSFDPVPRDSVDPARATWTESAAATVGHANVWSTISVDDKRGWVFLPTSSPSPDFFGGLRPGDNRHANSVVALDGATGARIWSFQTVHHDVWDYDLPSQPGLYTITTEQGPRDVVVQTAKTGLVFVLDRETGEPVIPVEERPVPQGGVAGEALSPTQPYPVRPEILVRDRLEPSDAFGVTLFDKMACASIIGKLKAEGLFTPPSLEGTMFYPFTGGGANWGSAAFDARRNLLVVNVNNLAQKVALLPRETADAIGDSPEAGVAIAHGVSEEAEVALQTGAPYGMSRELLLSPVGLPCTPPPWGLIVGVDVAKGEIVWRRPFGTTRDVAPLGLEVETGMANLGGPIVTAGDLIFITAAFDSYLRALDVETGKELWKSRLPASSAATPITYEWEGRQYVVAAAGGYSNFDSRMGDYLVAYALPRRP